jgi:cytochrome c6
MNLLRSSLCLSIALSLVMTKEEVAAFQPPQVPVVVVPSIDGHSGKNDGNQPLRTTAGNVVLTSALLLFSMCLPASAAADIAKGQTLFQANCAGCHAGGSNLVSESRTLRKEALQTYRGTVDAGVIQTFVQKGMPHKLLPMKTPMDDNDYGDVVAYVLDQALGEKW